MAEALYYKEKDRVLYVAAEGHITAALCADLRARAFERFDGAPTVEGMFVDLSSCDYMDSTFMGLLVGFNKRLLKISGKKLTIVKPTESCRGLLATLGVLSLVEVREDPTEFPPDMENVVRTQSTGAELLLKAHENLMELSEDNKKRFSALHSVLSDRTKD